MCDERSLLALLMILAVSCTGTSGNATSAGRGSAAPAPLASGTASPANGSPGQVPTDPPAPPASDKEIRAALLEAAGDKPVLLALDARGQLVARTVDGAFTRVLAPGPYGDGAADAERDLVWLRDDHKLDVLDLRGKVLVPVTAVTFPNKAMEQFGHITEPPSWTMNTFVNVMLATPCGKAAGLRLDWAHNGEATADWAKGFRAAARDWFASEEKRAAHPLGPNPYPSRSKKRRVPRDVGTCRSDSKEEYGKDRCGDGMPFGATGADLVVIGSNAGQCPASHCGLYDPKTKRFTAVPGIDPDDDAAPSCGPFLFDNIGTSFLVKDQACGPDLPCRSVGRIALGWVGGNRTLDKR